MPIVGLGVCQKRRSVPHHSRGAFPKAVFCYQHHPYCGTAPGPGPRTTTSAGRALDRHRANYPCPTDFTAEAVLDNWPTACPSQRPLLSMLASPFPLFSSPLRSVCITRSLWSLEQEPSFGVPLHDSSTQALWLRQSIQGRRTGC